MTKKVFKVNKFVHVQNYRWQKKVFKVRYPGLKSFLIASPGEPSLVLWTWRAGTIRLRFLEDHKERTAFTVGPLGFYEYNRMPFGLTNSPATYQRMMEDCISDCNLRICCIFIDDVIIFGQSYEEHLQNLELVFRRLREANLKLAYYVALLWPWWPLTRSYGNFAPWHLFLSYVFSLQNDIGFNLVL